MRDEICLEANDRFKITWNYLNGVEVRKVV